MQCYFAWQRGDNRGNLGEEMVGYDKCIDHPIPKVRFNKNLTCFGYRVVHFVNHLYGTFSDVVHPWETYRVFMARIEGMREIARANITFTPRIKQRIQ